MGKQYYLFLQHEKNFITHEVTVEKNNLEEVLEWAEKRYASLGIKVNSIFERVYVREVDQIAIQKRKDTHSKHEV